MCLSGNLGHSCLCLGALDVKLQIDADGLHCDSVRTVVLTQEAASKFFAGFVLPNSLGQRQYGQDLLTTIPTSTHIRLYVYMTTSLTSHGSQGS